MKKIDPSSASAKLRRINKKKWKKLLAEKTPETHAEVMQKLGISEEEDKKWHEEHDGEPANFSKLKKK